MERRIYLPSGIRLRESETFKKIKTLKQIRILDFENRKPMILKFHLNS